MEVITTGNIIDSSGIEHEYKIIHGKDINYNLLLNKTWKNFELTIFQRFYKIGMNKLKYFNYYAIYSFMICIGIVLPNILIILMI